MKEMKHFLYGKKEIEYLKSKDPILGAAIDEIGMLQRPVNPDLFSALINSIVGQQISSKAQKTVWERVQKECKKVTPEAISEMPDERLQQCGLSFRKVSYIKSITEAVISGEVDLESLNELSDEDVCTKLNSLKGIGVWTAEMLMIFSMQRPDILSYGDLAILRGLRMLYHHRKITPALFAKYKRRYSPYASVASLYLWAIAGGECPGMKD